MPSFQLTSSATQSEASLPERGFVTSVTVDGLAWAFRQNGLDDPNIDLAPAVPGGKTVTITYTAVPLPVVDLEAINEVLSQKASIASLNAKADASALAAKADQSALDALASTVAAKADAAAVATALSAKASNTALNAVAADVDTLEASVAGKADASAVNSALALKADASALAAKADASALSAKQDALVAGTNIKTVNGNSLLGSGDLVLDTGGASAFADLTDIDDFDIAAANAPLAADLAAKADVLAPVPINANTSLTKGEHSNRTLQVSGTGVSLTLGADADTGCSEDEVFYAVPIDGGTFVIAASGATISVPAGTSLDSSETIGGVVAVQRVGANKYQAVAPTLAASVSSFSPIDVTSTGTAVGDTATVAFAPGWNGSVKWQRDSSDIPGATGLTYEFVTDDAAHNVRPVVTSITFAGVQIAVDAIAPTGIDDSFDVAGDPIPAPWRVVSGSMRSDGNLAIGDGRAARECDSATGTITLTMDVLDAFNYEIGILCNVGSDNGIGLAFIYSKWDNLYYCYTRLADTSAPPVGSSVAAGSGPGDDGTMSVEIVPDGIGGTNYVCKVNGSTIFTRSTSEHSNVAARAGDTEHGFQCADAHGLPTRWQFVA